MSQQQTAPRRVSPVIPAFLVFLVAAACFGYAFWMFDGTALVKDGITAARALVLGVSKNTSPGKKPQFAGGAIEETPSADSGSLDLPKGMSEAFALRLWQEQIDSQQNISKLVSGSVRALSIDGSKIEGDRADLDVTVEFSDGSSAPGVLVMRRFNDVWYIAEMTGLRPPETKGEAETVNTGFTGQGDLPELSEVDIPLLQTLVREQQKSASVTQEYVEGIVQRVLVEKVVRGQGTVTLNLHMQESHGDADAQLVAVETQIAGRPHWFLARFARSE